MQCGYIDSCHTQAIKISSTFFFDLFTYLFLQVLSDHRLFIFKNHFTNSLNEANSTISVLIIRRLLIILLIVAHIFANQMNGYEKKN